MFSKPERPSLQPAGLLLSLLRHHFGVDLSVVGTKPDFLNGAQATSNESQIQDCLEPCFLLSALHCTPKTVFLFACLHMRSFVCLVGYWGALTSPAPNRCDLTRHTASEMATGALAVLERGNRSLSTEPYELQTKWHPFSVEVPPLHAQRNQDKTPRRIPSEHSSTLSRCHTPSKCLALAGSVGLKDARSLPNSQWQREKKAPCLVAAVDAPGKSLQRKMNLQKRTHTRTLEVWVSRKS